jgi:hypothetical protein
MNRVMDGVLFFNPGQGNSHYGVLEIDGGIKGYIYDIRKT